MEYENTITFTGRTVDALETAKMTLLPNGFQIINSNENSLSMKADNTAWLQRQNNALIGASEVYIHIENSTISLKAELKTVNRVIIFLIIFLTGLAILLAAIFTLIFSKTEGEHNIALISLIAFAPWPALLPLMFFFFKTRTRKVLDILLRNMAVQQIS